jgi:hypothetical protein
MAIVLPFKTAVPQNQDPRTLVLLSNTKVGKTSSVLQLPNSLIVDLEDGSGYYEGTALNIKRMAIEQKTGIDGKIDQIRLILNKLSDKTFLDICEVE